MDARRMGEGDYGPVIHITTEDVGRFARLVVGELRVLGDTRDEAVLMDAARRRYQQPLRWAAAYILAG